MKASHIFNSAPRAPALRWGTSRHPLSGSLAIRQRGFSLFLTLIALVVLLVAAVAIMRSNQMGLFSSGNLAFKQDSVARAELVNVRVYALLRSGGALGDSASLAASNTSVNYSATALPGNVQGIPKALIDDSLFSSFGTSSNDIVDADSNTTIRYLIERLCDQPGDGQILGKAHCVFNPDSNIQGGSSTQQGMNLPQNFSPIYRISVRVQGPRGTESYLQSTFLNPH